MSSPTASVVCAGLATVDMLMHVPDPIIAGAKHRARDSAITTGGSAVMTMEQRLAGPMAAEPEMCSLNMGGPACPRRARRC